VADPVDSPIGDDLGLGGAMPGRSHPDALGHARVHPITPLIHGVSSIPILVIILITMSGALTLEFGAWALLGGLALILLGVAAISAGSYVGWRNRTYWFDEDGDLRVNSGVINKQQRRIQLSRLQSVDIVQPIAARLFAMAALSLEVAGGSGSKVQLRYLTLSEARALRGEVLARAAGLRHDTAEAPEQIITRVPPRQLAISLLLRSTTAGLLILSGAFLVGTFLLEGWGGLGLALVTGGIPILTVVAEFMRYFNFTVAQSPDGLRLRFGLVSTQTRTVPPGRVQAIGLVEPFLWRRRGWVRVRINVAGVGSEQGSREETILTPVSDRATAAMLVALILPGVDFEDLAWHRAPERARRRSPIQWRALAVAWTGSLIAIRRGRITRHHAYVPHARTQSVRVTQGPWESRLGLASLHVDSTPGPVRISGLHLDQKFAWQVAQEQAARAQQARVTDASISWARPQVPESGHGHHRIDPEHT
jgi:putative membrane protein